MTEEQAPDDIAESCSVVVGLMREAAGERPVFHAIDVLAHRRGVRRPDDAVRQAQRLGYLAFDRDLTDATQIRVSVAGYYLVNPRDPLLHYYFVSVVRSLVDRWNREKLLSPTQAQPVVVFAAELEAVRDLDATNLRVLGHLLDTEPVGRVEWFDDPASPWGIEIDFWIRDFANVASIGDYLRVCREFF